MTHLRCETCAAFARDEPAPAPGSVVEVAPGAASPTASPGVRVAQCRRTAPPWSIVRATDWCLAWTPIRKPAPYQDND